LKLQVIRNYGALLIELSKIVPDGIIVFFPSYAYMRDLVLDWKQKGIIDEILKQKLIFIETKDIVETSNAMSHFREACRTGRGAIFLSVARGKVAEGVDFNNYRGRCVVMIGIPYQYSKSKPLLCRMEYLEAKYKINSKDFLTFDAMRQCSQCLGRVIRSKSDYGLMILADKRYAKNDKVDKLPDWIKDRVEQGRGEMQLNVAIQKAKEFFRQMGQPIILGKELFYIPEEEEETMQEKKG
jgi:DNA excision repair protein ERCC-2